MDPYDSDSSGFDDDGDFTETGVLLGYAADEIVEDTISHLGGWPTWLDNATPPPGDFAKCKVCSQPMLLLLELHGDLPNDFPHDERRLYIFSCPRKPCNRKPGSVRALRATRKLKIEQPPQPKKEEKPEPTEEKKTDPPAPKQDLGASLFGSSSLTGSVSASANPFSSGASSGLPSNPFAAPAPSPGLSSQPAKPAQTTPSSTKTLSESFADKVRVSSPPPTTQPPEASGPSAPWPSQSEFPAPYTQFYLDAEYETMSRPSTPTIPANVTIDNTEEEGAGGSGELKDAFESELDKAFIRFSTRLGHNPEQVLRYEFRGTPLLYSHADAVGKRLHDPKNPSPGARVTTVAASNRIPRCEYCGSERVFEFQLVPHAISVLEEGRDVGLGPKDDAGMEWGTIILGVCSKDCGPKEVGVVGYREEWAGVQWEEPTK
ncbi:small subunit rRNA maturation protein TSR4 [Aspergillus ibericus CBS 121593]|uniref:Putative PDCD2_C domain protein n=1 Tax=Aspergillus ibericus CBS 121593 TaxID=1448316 RepID=A0A395GWT0_9EURO|nr:putative PDCD2_C domain protein [Aspergillus ibericus CBS 121593]RAK99882.1 putative PDCD2_C domain protein [Aspergillus ibericus CBS 121593]